MQQIVECKLVVISNINNQNESVLVEGKGYYKEENGEVVVYFSSGDVKYKYVYNGDSLIVSCGDSSYTFRENKSGEGIIKNGDYIFKITTYATKIEVNNRVIVLEYNLSQNNQIIGRYKSTLSF